MVVVVGMYVEMEARGWEDDMEVVVGLDVDEVNVMVGNVGRVRSGLPGWVEVGRGCLLQQSLSFQWVFIHLRGVIFSPF